MIKRQNNFFGEGMRLVVGCPLCNAKYEPSEAALVFENDQGCLFHLDCRRCGSSILAAVLAGKMGVSSIGLVTDLTRQDVRKLKSAERVSADDLINSHQFFKKFNGSLAKTLQFK